MRKREHEEALERCRQMARKMAPMTLLSIAHDTTMGLIGTVASAHTTLGTVAQTLRIFVDRATRGITADASSGDRRHFGGAFATSLLDDALSELARLLALHHEVKLVHSFCGLSMPLTVVVGSDGRRGPWPMASWQRRRRDVLHHAWDARRKLRSAAAIARAIEDAVSLFLTSPVGSPDWTAWTSAALKLARHAAMALRALRRMRDAVAMEFYYAWRALNA